MATSTQDPHSHFETTLRDRLVAAQAHPQPQEPENAHASAVPGQYTPDPPQLHGADGQIDPLIGGPGVNQHQSSPPYDMGLDGMDMSNQKNGSQAGRRELSTTKRAAQNRAAQASLLTASRSNVQTNSVQRAFRQRKEAYITKLEKQVQDYRAMEEDFKALQHENYQLREYILSLQNRLLESSDDLPPPPRAYVGVPVDGDRPPHDPVDPRVRDNAPQPAPTASMTGRSNPDTISQAAVEQLQAAAAEAGSLEDGSTPKSES